MDVKKIDKQKPLYYFIDKFILYVVYLYTKGKKYENGIICNFAPFYTQKL
jgi:hypothetical protein